MIKFKVIREVSVDECAWLDESVHIGEIVYKFDGCTYGCISPNGIAVKYNENAPFFELPKDALKEI